MVRFQFGIKAILIFTFVAAIVMAVFSQTGSIFSQILLTVLLANFAGAIVALIVTFVFRFPRDGGFREAQDQLIDEQLNSELGDESGIIRKEY